MKEVPVKDRYILAPFFTDAYDSCAQSFLDGQMGRGFTDSLTSPTYGIIQLGDFCFFGGDGSGPTKQNVVSILKSLVKSSELIMVPLSGSWNQTLSEHPDFERTIRYAFDKADFDTFNEAKLTQYISKVAFDPDYIWGQSISRKFLMKPIDENYYHTLRKQDWSKDFVSNYPDYFKYQHFGLGYVIIEGATGTAVAGASTFSSSDKYLELQLATNPAFQGNGFATAVAARFILECLKRNKLPCWDAANLTSMHIAQKLGFHFSEEYVAYKRK